jgi:VanZ family protein
MLKWKIFRNKTVAFSWWIIMCILFFLPGSAFPTENWLSKIYFDKLVHIGLFAVLIFLWRSAFVWELRNYNLILLFSALLYGFAVEFIQRYFVPNRDFDMYDVLADTIGAMIGLTVWWAMEKNKPL